MLYTVCIFCHHCGILGQTVAWQEILQKDNGFDRCISGSTAAGDDLSDLEPLEDLQDFEALEFVQSMEIRE